MDYYPNDERLYALPSQEEAWENLAKDFYKRKTEKVFEIVEKRKD